MASGIETLCRRTPRPCWRPLEVRAAPAASASNEGAHPTKSKGVQRAAVVCGAAVGVSQAGGRRGDCGPARSCERASDGR
jgi:hypothetical protein